MPYPREHMLLQISGTLGNNPDQVFETFSFGLRFVPGNLNEPMASIDNDLYAEGLRDSFQARWVAADSGVNDMARVSSFKWNRIGTDGKYASNETRELGYSASVGVAGQSRPVYYQPPQCSLAVTLGTAKTRGLARWGRFYLPAPSFSVIPQTGTIGRGEATRVANHWGSWLDGLVTNFGQTGVGAQVVVMSKGRNGTGPGAMEPVTHVRVGGVIDTIRSRRTSIDEDYRIYQFGAA